MKKYQIILILLKKKILIKKGDKKFNKHSLRKDQEIN